MRTLAGGEAGMGGGALAALETLGGSAGGMLAAVLYYRVARRDSRSSASRSMVENAEAVTRMALEVVAPLHAAAVEREATIVELRAKIGRLEAELATHRGHGAAGAGHDLSP